MPDKDREAEERRRAHRLAWRVIAYFKKNPDWEIRYAWLGEERVWRALGFQGPIVGMTAWTLDLIIIDPSYKDLMAVLIHECLHAMLPDAEEDEVLKMEDLIRKHLTLKQARAFTILLADRLK